MKSNVKSTIFNSLCKNIKRRQGNICLSGHAVCDLDASAEIYLNDDLSLGHNLRKGSCAETYLKMHLNSKLYVNGFFRAFYNSNIEVFKDAVLTLGKGYLNSDSAIVCANRITIGDGVAIARGVFIYDSDHHKIFDDQDVQTNLPAQITIEENVWIGVGAVILKGVTIGDGTVIAAGAVVTRDIPPNCVAAGNPAQPIKSIKGWR